jgi:hypothetical protein
MAPPSKAKAPAKSPVTAAASAPVERSEVKGSGTSKAAPAAPSISTDAIAIRAFEIYAGRGYAQGDPSADWYEAERQLKAGL